MNKKPEGIIALWLCVLLLVVIPLVAGAQDQAAVLTIIYPGVEVRRANTAAWLPVSQQAVMPLGVGDSVRTNRRGRAMLNFASQTETLLLPQSELTLVQFDSDGVAAEQVGRSIYRRQNAVSGTFEVITTRATVSLESGLMGLEADPEATRLITAEGQSAALAALDVVEVPAGYGLRAQAGALDLIPLGQPASFARIDAILDGCPGLVQGDGVDYLNVRVGPGYGYDTVGQIANGTVVELLAISPNADRYRLQFLSGFAWVVASGIETTCTDLLVMPYSTLETVFSIFQPTALELDLLLPFFGTPEDDTWFFR